MALYTWAETCCRKIMFVIDSYYPYFYESSSQQDVPLRNSSSASQKNSLYFTESQSSLPYSQSSARSTQCTPTHRISLTSMLILSYLRVHLDLLGTHTPVFSTKTLHLFLFSLIRAIWGESKRNGPPVWGLGKELTNPEHTEIEILHNGIQEKD
jgi:hypothetical protein